MYITLSVAASKFRQNLTTLNAFFVFLRPVAIAAPYHIQLVHCIVCDSSSASRASHLRAELINPSHPSFCLGLVARIDSSLSCLVYDALAVVTNVHVALAERQLAAR